MTAQVKIQQSPWVPLVVNTLGSIIGAIYFALGLGLLFVPGEMGPLMHAFGFQHIPKPDNVTTFTYGMCLYGAGALMLLMAIQWLRGRK